MTKRGTCGQLKQLEVVDDVEKEQWYTDCSSSNRPPVMLLTRP
jgi:hypothetical protein